MSKRTIGGKVQFATVQPVELILPKIRRYLHNVLRLRDTATTKTLVVGQLPKIMGGKSKRLMLAKSVIEKVLKQHGGFPAENFVITANQPSLIVVLNEGNKINLIKQFSERGLFVIGANRINGYYAVTFFEPERIGYIQNRIIKQGQVFDFAGGAFSSFATSPCGAASQPASPQMRFPGVSKSRSNLPFRSEKVKNQ